MSDHTPSPATDGLREVPVDPYCPDHGDRPTAYDRCSCEARAAFERSRNPAPPSETATTDVAGDGVGLRDQVGATLASHRVMVSGDEDGWFTFCSCGAREPAADVTPDQHRADMLDDVIAARVAEAGARAWGEGYMAGWDDRNEDEVNPLPAGEQRDTANPYRARGLGGAS